MSQPVDIVFGADRKFLVPLAVSLRSLHERSPGNTAWVLNVDLNGDDVERLRRSAPSLSIHDVKIAADFAQQAQLPGYLPRSALFRLLTPHVLPDSVQRAMYLDSDTIARESIESVVASELGNSCVAAVRDPVVGWIGAPHRLPWREVGLAPDVPYFNSGVMVIDTSRWRELDVTSRAVALMERFRFPYGDQCALNFVLHGEWRQLPLRWNCIGQHISGASHAAVLAGKREADDAARDPAIVHFNTSELGRPWLSGCRHPFDDEWHALLSRTEFSAYRPSTLDQGRRVLRRARRVAAAVVGK